MSRQPQPNITAYYSSLHAGPIDLPIRVPAAYHYQEFWLPWKGRGRRIQFNFRPLLYPSATLDGVCHDGAIIDEHWKPFKQRRMGEYDGC